MDSTIYWKEHNGAATRPTEQDFYEWLEGLPHTIAAQMLSQGFEKCKGLLSLRLHAAERNFAALQQRVKAEF
jgi:hypothetical protein